MAEPAAAPLQVDEPILSKAPVGLPLDLPGRMGRGWTVAGQDPQGNVLLTKPSGNGISTITISPNTFDAVKKWRPNLRKHLVKKKVSASSFSLAGGGGVSVKGFDAAGGGNYLVSVNDGRGGISQKWVSGGDLLKFAGDPAKGAGDFLKSVNLSLNEPAPLSSRPTSPRGAEGTLRSGRTRRDPSAPSDSARDDKEENEEEPLTEEEKKEPEISVIKSELAPVPPVVAVQMETKTAPRPRAARGALKVAATVAGSVAGGAVAGAAAVAGTVTGTVSGTASAAVSTAASSSSETAINTTTNVTINQQRELMRQQQAERRTVEASIETDRPSGGAPTAAAAPALAIGSTLSLSPQQSAEVRTLQKTVQQAQKHDAALGQMESAQSVQLQQAQGQVAAIQGELITLTDARNQADETNDIPLRDSLDARIGQVQASLGNAQRQSKNLATGLNGVQRQRVLEQQRMGEAQNRIGTLTGQPTVAPQPAAALRRGVGVPASPQIRPAAPTAVGPNVSGPAVPVKPPLGAQLSGEPSATEAQRASSLSGAQQRDRLAAKPGGGETGQGILSDAGTGSGVLQTIPETYGAVPEEEKGIRQKEQEMTRTQEQLLGPTPSEQVPPEGETLEEKEQREKQRAGELAGQAFGARQAAEQQAAQGVAAMAVSQPAAVSQGDQSAQAAFRAQKTVWLMSFYGMPLYAAVGTLQLANKLIGSPMGKKFESEAWEDGIAIFLDVSIALFFFGIVYLFISILGAISSIPGVNVISNIL